MSDQRQPRTSTATRVLAALTAAAWAALAALTLWAGLRLTDPTITHQAVTTGPVFFVSVTEPVVPGGKALVTIGPGAVALAGLPFLAAAGAAVRDLSRWFRQTSNATQPVVNIR